MEHYVSLSELLQLLMLLTAFASLVYSVTKKK